MRGPPGLAEKRGDAPSPAALRAATSPRTRGEVHSASVSKNHMHGAIFQIKRAARKVLIHRHKCKAFDFAAAVTITAPSRSLKGRVLEAHLNMERVRCFRADLQSAPERLRASVPPVLRPARGVLPLH